MKKRRKYHSKYICFIVFFVLSANFYAQEEATFTNYKNQISTNLGLPFFGSFDLSYERTIANKWAAGVGGISFGEGFNSFRVNTADFGTTLELKYEINPFVRLYFQGNQKKSHFVELFGSVSWEDETNIFARTNNEEGFGVYTSETKPVVLGALGIGYGYRFLLVDNKLVLEAQVGYRTNFKTDFFVLNGAPIRTGIKVGYRF